MVSDIPWCWSCNESESFYPQEENDIICIMYVCINHVGNVSLELYNKHVQKKGRLLTKLNKKYIFTVTTNSEWTHQFCIIKWTNSRIPLIWHWRDKTGAGLPMFWIIGRYLYSLMFLHAIFNYCPQRMFTSVICFSP
jgi:hypothetical protein